LLARRFGAGPRDADLARNGEAVDDLPVPNDATISEVVDGHALDVDAATRWRQRSERTSVRPAHRPCDGDAVVLRDDFREVKMKIGEWSAGRDEPFLEPRAGQGGAIPGITWIAMDRVLIREESVDRVKVASIPHRVHEFGERVCVICHDGVFVGRLTLKFSCKRIK